MIMKRLREKSGKPATRSVGAVRNGSLDRKGHEQKKTKTGRPDSMTLSSAPFLPCKEKRYAGEAGRLFFIASLFESRVQFQTILALPVLSEAPPEGPAAADRMDTSKYDDEATNCNERFRFVTRRISAEKKIGDQRR
jgi:hypothetical protein